MFTVDKIKELLLRDAGGENESGRAVYILRTATLGQSLFFVLFTIALLTAASQKLTALLPAICCALALLVFRYTFLRQTQRALAMFYVITIAWIILGVIFFGWDCGTQHMAFVLLLFVFTTSYLPSRVKILLGFLVYGLRMGLYFYMLKADPLFPLTGQLNSALQFLNTTTVYLLLILIMSVFAGDTLRAEGKLAKANRKLNALAETDPLTKLPNRRFILRHIEECVHGSPDPICPTIAIGDIDFFKKVNDTYGHEAGDRVLEVLSELFQKTMEPYGVCARWGGEEFLFFFEHLNLDNAQVVLYELLSKIRVTVIPFGDQQLKVTLTFGVEDAVLSAKTPEEITRQVDAVIQKADEKLYIGKEQGRNRIVA